jgi:hypothetical protein
MWCQDVLDLAEAVDVIISTAALHWVSDDDRMWGRRYGRAGSAEAQSGGNQGNTTSLVSASSSTGSQRFPELVGWSPWVFASPQETERPCARPASARFGAAGRPANLPEDIAPIVRD